MNTINPTNDTIQQVDNTDLSAITTESNNIEFVTYGSSTDTEIKKTVWSTIIGWLNLKFLALTNIIISWGSQSDSNVPSSLLVKSGLDAVTMTHDILTVSNNDISYVVVNKQYKIASISANTSVKISGTGTQENYLLLINTSSSTVTVAFSSDTTIIGEPTLDIATGKALDVAFLYSSTYLIITYSAPLTV